MRYDDGCYEGKKRTVEKSYVLEEYPKFRKNKDFRFVARFWKLCRKLYRIEISGLENIPEKESFLICPNHESYMDGMWIAAALQDKGVNV